MVDYVTRHTFTRKQLFPHIYRFHNSSQHYEATLSPYTCQHVFIKNLFPSFGGGNPLPPLSFGTKGIRALHNRNHSMEGG